MWHLVVGLVIVAGCMAANDPVRTVYLLLTQY